MMLKNLLLLAFASCCLAVSTTNETTLQHEVQTEQIIQEKQAVQSAPKQVKVEPKTCGHCHAQAGDIAKLYYNSGEWLNIFVDVAFKCSGRVSRWELFAKKPGKVFLTVWRPTRKGNAWRLVGKNLVLAGKTGKHVFHIKKRQQIFARKGDVIGVQYPCDDLTASQPTERGVVPYENDDDFLWGNPMGLEDTNSSSAVPESSSSFPFSRIHNTRLFDEDINPKRVRHGLRTFKRRAALAAFITERNPCRPNPCKNGGKCEAVGDGFKCECPPDYIGKDCGDSVECELSGGPLEHLAYNAGTWLNIFADFKFPCSGRIVEWRFYAQKTGRMFLAAWKVNSYGSFSLIGKNYIEVENLGENRVTISRDEQIEVEAGDVFGIHYPDNLANDIDDRGVVPYTDTRKGAPPLCCGLKESQLSEIYNVKIQDTAIMAKKIHNGQHMRYFKRAIALAAIVHNPICGLQLGPRAHLTYDSGQWLNIFVNRPVKCEGKLIHWEFYAKLPGTVYLSVWTGDMDAGFTLKGYNKITVKSTESEQTMSVKIPEAEQLDVSQNDVIGIFYPDRTADATTDRGIIPYRNNEDFPWWTSIYKGDDDEEESDFNFLQIHNVDIQASSIIDTGYIAGGPYRPFERIPALAVYVDESKSQTVKVL